jgi:hypothetical protein
MSKKKYYLFCIAFFTGVTACAQKEYILEEEVTYHISTDSLSESLNFNEVFEDYFYVSLKQTSDYSIGEISQLLATDNRLFIVSEGIYCYDFDGNPIYKISNKGHARNEYITCESVSISDSLLYMYDRAKLQTHVYDVYTGKFLYNITSPIVEKLYRVGKGFVIEDLFHLYTQSIFKNSNCRFFAYNEDLSSMNFKAFSKEQHLCYLGQPTSLGPDGILFSDLYECKVYKILHDKVISYLQIDCDPKYMNTPQQIHKALHSANIRKDDIEALQHVCETKSHIYGRFIFKEVSYHFIFDKRSKHSKIWSYFNVGTPQICSESLTARRYTNNDYFFLIFTPETIIKRLKWMKPIPKSHPEYNKYKTLLDCKPDDNPIIAFYKFKNF